MDLRVLAGLTDLPGFEDLRDPPLAPAAILSGAAQADVFSMIDERDVLLHHPYDAYDPVVALAGAGRGGSGRARDQADALPGERRLADDRQPSARR